MKYLFSKAFVIIGLFLSAATLNAQHLGYTNLPMPSVKYNYPIKCIDSTVISVNPQRFYNESIPNSKLPFHIGFSTNVDISTYGKGSIIRWPSGEISWLLKVSFQGAPAAAFVFDSLLIPDKGKIFVYSPKSPDSYFEITNANIVNGRTSTPPFTLGPVVIEYVENNSMNVSEPQGSFKISEAFFISKGSDGQDLDKELGASGPCHVNINCSPEGDNWQNQKRGVAKILLKVGSNLYVCTGALVNNTKQDGTPYFLTAEHCGGSASEADRSVWQFYFNYEQTGCPNVGTPPNHVITGSVLVASGKMDNGSDFQLLKLSQKPPETWRPYYNGWDRTGAASVAGVGIHHPEGDVKKISTYNLPLVTSTPTIESDQMAEESAWRVIWSETENGFGVTEGGSSGSPIFNSDGLLVGTLSGGSSSCENTNFPDYYGKFTYHWTSNGINANNQLKPWLDPQNTNVSFLPGFDPSGELYANFKANKLVAQVGENLLFSDLSTGDNITSWLWDFGEGAQPKTANTKGPHEVLYASGGLKTVSLTINGSETNTKEGYIRVQEVPANAVLFDGFEGDVFPPVGWASFDIDGDSYSWFAYSVDGTAFSGQKSAASSSWDENTGALTPDNWLVAPAVEITHDNFILEYRVAAQDPVYPFDKYGVFVSNQTRESTDFELLFEETLQNGEWQFRQVSLKDYLGDIIYIAFRHYDCTDWFYVKLDDVMVMGGSDDPSDQARIHSFGFTEGGVIHEEVTDVVNGEADILIELDNSVQITSLTPEIRISQGATINYTPGTSLDFSNTVFFDVTSESGLVTNSYGVSVKYAAKHNVQFHVFDSDYYPVSNALVSIEGVDNLLSTNSEGKAFIDLYRGTYSFTVSANDFNQYTNSFTLIDESLDVNVRMVSTSSPQSAYSDIVVFPNPFEDNLHIRGLSVGNKITIVNILGEVVIRKNSVVHNEMFIPTALLPSGLYIVIIEDLLGSCFVQKIFKR